MAVTPVAGLVSQVTTGGVAVVFDPGTPNGGFITNPVSNTDQGISPAAAENLYIDPTGAAATLTLVIAGQLLAALTIDRLGWFGVTLREISLGRASGVLLVFALLSLMV